MRRTLACVLGLGLLVACGGDGAGGAGGSPPASCGFGSWDHDGDLSTPCQPWSTCGADEHVVAHGTPTSDRVCAGCGADEYWVTEGTPPSDRVCEPLTECADDEFVSHAATATSDRTCAPCAEGETSVGPAAAQCAPRQLLSLAAGSGFTCGIRPDDREVVCWGCYYYWETGCSPGDGGLDAPAGVAFDSLSAGLWHACGIRSSDHEVVCWGDNFNGVLDAPPGVALDSVSAGGEHTCAIRSSDHEVVCWGVFVSEPAPGVAFDAVSAGAGFTCGIRSSDHEVVCWGDNGLSEPAPGVAFGSLASSADHTCAIRSSDHEVVCWDDWSGTLNEPLPGVAFDSITCGDGWEQDCCGKTSHHGRLACLGEFEDEVPGANEMIGEKLELVTMGGGYDLGARSHRCAINSVDGQLVCWGNDDGGQVSEAPSSH